MKEVYIIINIVPSRFLGNQLKPGVHEGLLNENGDIILAEGRLTKEEENTHWSFLNPIDNE